MGITRIYDTGAVAVAGSSGFNIDGITSATVNTGSEVVAEGGAGQVDPTFAAQMSIKPMIEFSASDLSTMLTNFFLSGLKIPSTTVFTTATFQFTRTDEGGTRMAGSTNFRHVMNEGIIVPRSISAPHGSVATMSLAAHPTYDGTNAILVYTDGAALTHVPSVDELFTLGKVMINGTELNGVTGFTLDTGIDVLVEASGGELYPTFCTIIKRRPKFTITSRNLELLNTFGINGTAQGSTDSLVYLQAMAENGSRVAAATTSHISFSIDDGIITVDSGGGSQNAAGELTLTITPTFDGTAGIVVVAVGVAIA